MFGRVTISVRVAKQAIVCQLTDKIDAALMDAASDLKVIANVAVGFDNIDIPAATERGIVVTNTPGVLTDTTADLAFTLLMAASRRIAEADRFLRSGQWHQWEIDMFTGHDIHADLHELVSAQKPGRESDQERIYFNAVGLAYIDVAIANAMYQRALEAGVGTPLDLQQCTIFEHPNIAEVARL